MDLKPINQDVSSITLVTFTSGGYIDITQNLCNSNIKNNVDYNINIFCLDSDSLDHNFGDNTKNIDFTEKKVEGLNSDELMQQNSKKFGNLMFKKFEIIYKGLNEFENVLYIDGDIVFKKPFIKQLTYNYKFKDIVFQNDKRPSKPNDINLCAGFMLIKSNKKMIKFFNPENISGEKLNNYRTNDQTHINRNKSKFKYNVLPLDEFPNGPKFYDNFKNIDPRIIHFNYVKGYEKIELMKKYGEWYL